MSISLYGQELLQSCTKPWILCVFFMKKNPTLRASIRKIIIGQFFVSILSNVSLATQGNAVQNLQPVTNDLAGTIRRYNDDYKSTTVKPV